MQDYVHFAVHEADEQISDHETGQRKIVVCEYRIKGLCSFYRVCIKCLCKYERIFLFSDTSDPAPQVKTDVFSFSYSQYARPFIEIPLKLTLNIWKKIDVSRWKMQTLEKLLFLHFFSKTDRLTRKNDRSLKKSTITAQENRQRRCFPRRQNEPGDKLCARAIHRAGRRDFERFRLQSAGRTEG